MSHIYLGLALKAALSAKLIVEIGIYVPHALFLMIN